MEPQATFFDDDVGPNLGNKISLADDLVRAGDQSDQDVQGSPAQVDGGVASYQAPFARDQAERTKRDDVSGHCPTFVTA
jgi:hypothetical protein